MKKELVSILFVSVVLVSFFYLFFGDVRLSGFAVLSAGSHCDDPPVVLTDLVNTMNGNVDCLALNGPEINQDNSILYCGNFSFLGTGGGNIDLTISASNVNISSCHVTGFTTPISPSSGFAFRYWYLNVTVKDTSGNYINTANINVTGSGGGISYIGTTNVNGLFLVNVSSARIGTSAATYAPFDINITKSGFSENSTEDFVGNNDGSIVVIMNNPPDTTAPRLTILNPINKTYNSREF